MRVLYITTYSDMYGANQSLLSLIGDMRDRYNVTACVLSKNHGLLDSRLNELKTDHIKSIWIQWRTSRFTNPVTRLFARFINRCFFYPITFLKVKRYNPDLIHTNTSVTDIGLYLSQRIQKPCIWHLREYGDVDYNLSYIVNEKKAYDRFSKANCLIAVSESIRNYYKNKDVKAPIELIYNGVSGDFKKREKRNDNAFHICMIGVLNEGKNQLELLKAITKLYIIGFRDIEVYFLGTDPKHQYICKLQNYIEENGLSKNIHFCGFMEDVSDVLKNMDVGIITSKNEAFGRVIVEYMLSSLPVIATNSGGAKEIISEGVDGFLYTPGDIDGLCGHIMALYRDRSLINKMGCNGNKKACMLFSQSNCTDAVFSVYKKVLIQE